MDAGTPAPDFELPDQHGTPVRLSALLAQGPVVLFFYPAALTPGCTAESCHFRDLSAEFAELGASVVGVSADTVDTQAAFAAEHGFDYPLLSDADGAVAESFGVRRTGPLEAMVPTRRRTFVIDTDGRVLHQVSSEIRMNVHADGALEALRKHREAGR